MGRGEKSYFCKCVGKSLVILFVQERFQNTGIIVHHEIALMYALVYCFPVVVASITGYLVGASPK